jgi:hypothetical protein
MFKRLIDFIFQRDRFKTVIIVEPGQSIEIPSKTLVLTKKGNTYTWIRYKCPCGCGELISLSLTPVITPNWSMEIAHENSKRPIVTIAPSVYMRNTKCCSHYFITENKVIWCK